MAESNRQKRTHILTIQSAVMAGFVGNNAAMAVYDYFSIPHYRLDTVRLAAHPGFGKLNRDVTEAHTMDHLLNDFRTLPHFQRLGAVQTGYLGAVAQVEVLAQHITEMKQDFPIRYFLDPVMGDNGKLYVTDALAEKIAEKLLPLADVITPNLFEFERLAQLSVNTPSQIITIAPKLIAQYQLEAILVTGIPDGDQIIDMLVTAQEHAAFSHQKHQQGHSGAGDMLTALLIGFVIQGHSLVVAAQQATELVTACAAHAEDPRDLEIQSWLYTHRSTPAQR